MVTEINNKSVGANVQPSITANFQIIYFVLLIVFDLFNKILHFLCSVSFSFVRVLELCSARKRALHATQKDNTVVVNKGALLTTIIQLLIITFRNAVGLDETVSVPSYYRLGNRQFPYTYSLTEINVIASCYANYTSIVA